MTTFEFYINTWYYEGFYLKGHAIICNLELNVIQAIN